MKLLNINTCIKLDNANDIIKLISDDEYNIVTLQEVMRKIDDAVFDKYNKSNIIKSNTSYKYSFFGPLWIADHHEKNNVISKEFGGFVEQGNEILSIYPIAYSENVFYYKNYSNFTDTTNFRQEDHPRAFENVILNINDQKLQIINVHGIWNKDKTGDERTINQSEVILSYVRDDIPCIITGDFNLLSNTESIKKINKKMTNLIEEYNIQSTRPTFDDGLDKGDLVCDYIFVNEKVKVNDFKVLNYNASDHLPLVLDFDI